MIRTLLPKLTQRNAESVPLGVSLKQRSLLVFAIALAVAVTYTLTYAGAVQGDDPALLRLLRGMVILKGVIGLGVLGLIFWRMGRPLAAPQWTIYMVAAVLIPIAVTWLWSLRLIPIGSLLFYSGLIIAAVGVRRDSDFVRSLMNRQG